MLAPSPVIKAAAKESLRDRFLQSVVVCCVLIFLYFVTVLIGSMVSVFTGNIGYVVTVVLLIFAESPLLWGVINYFRRQLYGQKDDVLIIFKFLSSAHNYKRALSFSLHIMIRLIGLGLMLYSPCIVVWILSNEEIYEFFDISLPIWTSNLWALNSFLAFLAFLALIFLMLKYYLAPFIFVSNDTVDPDEAVNMSTIISKRTGGDFFGLVLSFAGWMVLSLFVAPLIFTLPYFIASYCVHCQFAVIAYNRDVDRFNASVAPSYSTDEF